MAKEALFHNKALAWLIRKLGAFPVTRGTADIQSVKTAMQVIKEGQNLLIFPEGTRVRRGKPSEPHSGALLIATRMKVPVIPVYLSTKKYFWQ